MRCAALFQTLSPSFGTATCSWAIAKHRNAYVSDISVQSQNIKWTVQAIVWFPLNSLQQHLLAMLRSAKLLWRNAAFDQVDVEAFVENRVLNFTQPFSAS